MTTLWALAPRREPEANEVHVYAAVQWLLTAQNAVGGVGFAHSFHPLHGWQPAYPETTGYIIPTLHRLYRQNGDPELSVSIIAAIAWLKSVQRDDGSFADLHGRAQVFDTGQILIGLNYLAEHAPDLLHDDMHARAGRWLVSVQEADGSFITHAYNNVPHSYYVRVGAALAVTGRLLNDARLRDAAEANLRWTLAQQEPNGFFRHLSFDRSPPFLHTMIYTIEGLLDGYDELRDPSFLVAATRFAAPLLAISSRDCILRSQYYPDFTIANPEKCMTGLAQWAGVCLRLASLNEDESYRDEGLRVVSLLKRRQIRCRDGRLNGGLWGSDPIWGRYMRFSIPNWGVKFFIDALMMTEHVGIDEDPVSDRITERSRGSTEVMAKNDVAPTFL